MPLSAPSLMPMPFQVEVPVNDRSVKVLPCSVSQRVVPAPGARHLESRSAGARAVAGAMDLQPSTKKHTTLPMRTVQAPRPARAREVAVEVPGPFCGQSFRTPCRPMSTNPGTPSERMNPGRLTRSASPGQGKPLRCRVLRRPTRGLPRLARRPRASSRSGRPPGRAETHRRSGIGQPCVSAR